MDESKIKKLLTTEKLGQSLELFDVIEYSTNQRVKELLSHAPGEPRLVAADKQLGGRGRLGRSWDGGEKGDSLPFSFPVPAPENLEDFPALTLVIALGVRAGILKLAPELSDRLKIKWPNDLLVGNKKLCGILVELCSAAGKNFAVVGIGINTGQRDFGEFAGQRTSLKMEGVMTANEEVLAAVCNELEERIERFLAEGFGSMGREYEDALVCMNRPFKIAGEENDYVCRGVDEKGRLLGESGGGIKAFDGGEVSIRGDFYV